jgi:hypothetical protein
VLQQKMLMALEKLGGQRVADDDAVARVDNGSAGRYRQCRKDVCVDGFISWWVLLIIVTI